MKPWYVLIWALVFGVGGSLSAVWFGTFTEYSLISFGIHTGIPIVIYFWLKKRQSKS